MYYKYQIRSKIQLNKHFATFLHIVLTVSRLNSFYIIVKQGNEATRQAAFVDHKHIFYMHQL